MTSNGKPETIDGVALGRAIVAEALAAAKASAAGVRIVTPHARPEIDATTNVTVNPGLAWVAQQMQRWRERTRPAAGRGYDEWRSAEEIASALAFGVRPVIRHLAQSLVVLLEAANSAASEEDLALVRAATSTETMLALWDELHAELLARRFPVRQWSGESLFRSIPRRLDGRLDAVFATVVDLANQPMQAAMRYADASGTVTLSVSFDCQSEVRRFADWARWHWQPRSGCDWSWLLLAFAAGWWFGHD